MMATLGLPAGISAFTSALKHVYYVHKEALVERNAKIELLTKENDALRHKKSPDAVAGPCQSCKALEDLNKALQKKFERRLKDKDGAINHLEERLEQLLLSVASDTCAESVKTLPSNEGNNSPHTRRSGASLACHSSPDIDKKSSSVMSTVNSPSKGPMAGSKLSSKLKLPKEGQKRRLYVEQENTLDSKKRKLSPISAQTENDQTDSQQDNTDRRLTRKHSREFQKVLPCQSKNVLVPETVNFTCQDESIVSAKSGTDVQSIKDITNAKYQNFITIPETLVVDEFSQDFDESGDDDSDLENTNTLKDVEKLKLQGSSEVLTSPNNSHRSFCPASGIYKNISHSGKRDLQGEGGLSKNEKDSSDSYKVVNKDPNSVSVSSAIEHLNNISMASPISPGIFDELAGPLSNSNTPRSSKSADSHTGRRFISCCAKPAADKRGLLRQTTLSQSFCNYSHNSKQGVKKSRSLRSKSEFDNEEEEAILKKVIEQSLVDANKNAKGEIACVNPPSSKNTTHGLKSPFKVPLSPSKELRKSPRSKVSKSRVYSKNDKNDCSLKESGGNRKVVIEECESNSFHENALAVSSSSPDRSVTGISGDGLRRSPRLKSSSPRSSRSPGVSGDLAKRALFPQNKKKLSHWNPYSGLEQIQNEDSADEEGSGVTNTVGSLGMNASVDPIMRLSMYLDSENPSTVRSRPPTDSDRDHTSSPISLHTEVQEDMDETVAPHALLYTASAVTGDRMGQKTGTPSQQCLDDNDDSGDANQDDMEEMIAPSPQNQSVRPFQSQSLSGLPSSCQSFRFVTTVKHNGTSSKSLAEEKIDQGMQVKDDEVCLNDGNNSDDDNDYEVFDVENATASKTIMSGRKTSLQQPVQSLASLYDSFDVVPKKSPEFPHVQVVRKKADRDKLQGFSCHQCAQYFKDMNLSEEELQQRMRACSRHKEKYRAPDTPEHFWSLSIRDTAEDQLEEKEKQPEVVRLRRRTRLGKKFKSKTEEDGKAE